MTVLPGMRQGDLGARDELHAAQALVRAHLRRQANLASYPPGPRCRRGRAHHWQLLRWPVHRRLRCACKAARILTPAIAAFLEGLPGRETL